MSNPYPTLTREISELDLKIYLNSIQKRIDNYKPAKDDYSLSQIKKLDQMAVEAIARFHNQ